MNVKDQSVNHDAVSAAIVMMMIMKQKKQNKKVMMTMMMMIDVPLWSKREISMVAHCACLPTSHCFISVLFCGQKLRVRQHADWMT